jgi:hypothetical protein
MPSPCLMPIGDLKMLQCLDLTWNCTICL